MNALDVREIAPEESPRTDTNQPARGWFLTQHNARVIDRGDVFVVEFPDRPWYTEARRRESRRNARLCLLLQALHLI